MIGNQQVAGSVEGQVQRRGEPRIVGRTIDIAPVAPAHLAGELADDAVGRDLADHHVAGVRDIHRTACVDGDTRGKAELRGVRRAVGEPFGAGAGPGADDAGRADPCDAMVVLVGDIQIALRVDRNPGRIGEPARPADHIARGTDATDQAIADIGNVKIARGIERLAAGAEEPRIGAVGVLQSVTARPAGHGNEGGPLRRAATARRGHDSVAAAATAAAGDEEGRGGEACNKKTGSAGDAPQVGNVRIHCDVPGTALLSMLAS
jgi:hypothetical protein